LGEFLKHQLPELGLARQVPERKVASTLLTQEWGGDPAASAVPHRKAEVGID